ncbi:MAG TPA: metallophosphoesterase [Candidatus Acidoferrales bacterium]|nr:metallophosphoesterase [Candidatus Acidoferrales bacterium]
MRRIWYLWVLCLCVWSAAPAAQKTILPLEPGSVRFVVIGDMGTGAAPQYDIAARMAELHKSFPFDFVIMVGDNIYGGKSPHDFAKKFDDPYKPLLDDGVKFYASLGNHDVPAEEFYKPFNMNGHRYYAFDKGNVRFYALDSNYMDPDQLKWLGNDLRDSNATWKIPFFHHPLYSSGATHGSSVELRHLLEPVFVETGVRVVFSGHDHIYERMKPQQGIYYFVEGSAGQLRAGDLRPAPFEATGFDKDRTFMAVEIAGDDMFFETISRSGEMVDSGQIHLKD